MNKSKKQSLSPVMLAEKAHESDEELNARIKAHFADKSMQLANVNYA